MKIFINSETENMIKTVLNKTLMLSNNKIIVIMSIDIQDVKETRITGFWKKTTETKVRRCVVDAKILSYHTEGKFIGTLQEGAVDSLLTWYNLYKLRNQWLEFKEMINAFGFEFTKIENDNVEKTLLDSYII